MRLAEPNSGGEWLHRDSAAVTAHDLRARKLATTTWIQSRPALGPVRGSQANRAQGLTQRLERDFYAAKAALTLPWSQGHVEGQVQRLKLIKRQMYGRAPA